MATAADEEDYDRAMEQAARQSGAMTDAVMGEILLLL